MSELENIEDVEEVETIPTDNTTEELQENVEQSTGDNELAEQERLQRELKLREQREQEEREREEAEEQARLQAIQEHEALLNSFPETTVFYRDLLVNGNVKSLGTVVRDPHIAEQWGFLDNHFDESELTYIGTPECGIWYLKGYEKPDQSEQELIEQKIKAIDSQLEQYMDNKVHVEKDYKNIESCVSYFNSTDDEFRSNARAALRWRDDIYKVGREVRDKVLAGELDWHEIDMQYILDRVDPLEW